MNLNEVINGLLAEIRKISDSETVVGKPIVVGDATIVPVSKLSIGFGTGTLEGKATAPGGRADGYFEGGGAGGGIRIEPQAFVVVDKSGQAQLLSLKDSKVSAVSRAIELVPQVLDRVLGEGGAGQGAASRRIEPVRADSPKKK